MPHSFVVQVIRLVAKERCVRGVWMVNGDPQGVTLELPWKNNQNDVSCIPVGDYVARFHRTQSPQTLAWRETYQLRDVPGRSGINFDVANVAAEIRGCIALGLRYGRLDGKPAVLQSKPACDRLMTLAKNRPEILVRVSEALAG